MRDQVHCLVPLLISLILCVANTKSVIEPCSSSDSCPSLLSYLVPWDSELSEIAHRFQLDVSEILAANNVFPIAPSLDTQILPANSLVKIPFPCPCMDGIRRSTSTTYIVHAADTIDSIAQGYGGLVSAHQIVTLNSINRTNPLTNGESLTIPLPCACFNNSNNGETAMYMAYVVQRGESLSSIAAEFATTMTDLEAINALSRPEADPGDILGIPISACSSVHMDWHNESLMVAKGSYALTANNCIKCACREDNLELECSPSGLDDVTCYNLQCRGSNLLIGEEYVNQTPTGCQVSSCIYRGHNGGKIFRSLRNSTYSQCPSNRTHMTSSPWPFSFSPDAQLGPIVEAFSPSPSASPSPTSNATPRVGGAFSSSSRRKLKAKTMAECLVLLHLLAFCTKHLFFIFFFS